jgi:NADH-quinone oxidoreductase subunit E
MDLLERTYPNELRAAIAKYPPGRQASAVLPLMYLAQAAYGYLSSDAVDEVADLLEMDRTQVRGLVGFYSLFYDQPVAGWVLQFCTDLPCALRGAEEFFGLVCEKAGAPAGGTSADGLFTVESVMCLAACDRAPMMQVNLQYYYDLTPESLDAIIAELRARAATRPARRPPFGLGPPDEVGGAVKTSPNGAARTSGGKTNGAAGA